MANADIDFRLDTFKSLATEESVERIIMLADMDSFFAACEQAANPFLRGKPVAVCGKPNSRSVVAASSYEAKALGIKSGMSTQEARRIHPDLICVPADIDKYTDTSLKVLAIFRKYVPRVEVFSIDEAYLEVMPSEPLYAAPMEIGRQIKRHIKGELGLNCTIGIGPNKLIAKLICGMHKPDGLGRITAAEVPALIEHLPVTELCGIGSRMGKHLHALGIHTCGELGRFPVQELRRRFGIIGEILHRMGLGIDDSPVNPSESAHEYKSMGHSLTLNKDTYDVEAIRTLLLQLSEKVARRLRREYYSGRCITLTLRDSAMTTAHRQKRYDDFIDDGLEIYRRAESLINSVMKKLKSHGIRMVGVSVSELQQHTYQLSLFKREQIRRAINETIDTINDKYGEFTLTRGRLAGKINSYRFISRGWQYQQHEAMQQN